MKTTWILVAALVCGAAYADERKALAEKLAALGKAEQEQGKGDKAELLYRAAKMLMVAPTPEPEPDAAEVHARAFFQLLEWEWELLNRQVDILQQRADATDDPKVRQECEDLSFALIDDLRNNVRQTRMHLFGLHAKPDQKDKPKEKVSDVRKEVGPAAKIAKAHRLLEEGRTREALALAEEVLRIHPDDPDVLALLNKGRELLSRTDAAYVEARELVARGKELELAGKLDGATHCYELALERLHADPDMGAEAATLYAKIKEHLTALRAKER